MQCLEGKHFSIYTNVVQYREKGDNHSQCPSRWHHIPEATCPVYRLINNVILATEDAIEEWPLGNNILYRASE
jgi:hypothetical protein